MSCIILLSLKMGESRIAIVGESKEMEGQDPTKPTIAMTVKPLTLVTTHEKNSTVTDAIRWPVLIADVNARGECQQIRSMSYSTRGKSFASPGTRTRDQSHSVINSLFLTFVPKKMSHVMHSKEHFRFNKD